MATWTADELDRFDKTDELGLASRRADGTLRPYVTTWMVRAGDDVYVRSAYGPDNPWYRRARTSGAGRVRVDATEHDVTFTEADDDTQADIDADIDAAYHAKYDRYGPRIVGSVVGPAAAAVTLRLVPRR